MSDFHTAMEYPESGQGINSATPGAHHGGGGQQHSDMFDPRASHRASPQKTDEEKGSVYDVQTGAANAPDLGISGGNLHRAMKARHIQMISIGGVIGTGLFLGTAGALANGGPVGLLLGYTVMGSVVWCVMQCLGEMIAHLPIAGGHITLARRFVDPALAFTMGWNYWYNWTIVLPAELSASAVLVSYWKPNVNNGVFIAIFLVFVVLINLGGARFYAEFEFWFASIKVITIIGLIILGLIIDLGGIKGYPRLGFHFWKHPGPFVQYAGIEGSLGRFLGFWAVLIQASFSYIGTEITAITAGEAENPKKNLPKAIRTVALRICLFYIGGTFVIGLLVASDDERLNLANGTSASSPFVIAIKDAGITALPSIINACLLTSAWSAASSDLYTSSRALYGLSLAGNAPAVLSKTTSWGLPWVCLVVGTAFSMLSFMSVGATGAGKVFGYFANMTSVAGLLTWVGIFITWLRFNAGVKAQNIDRGIFPYRSSVGVYGAWYGLVLCCLILFFNTWSVFLNTKRADGFDSADFITGYLPVMLFPCLYVGARLYYKFVGVDASPIAPSAMDFYTHSRDPERDYEEPVPVGVWAKLKAWI